MEQLPENTDSTGEAEPGSLAVIAATIGTYFGRMPAALQRNFTKAAGHLFKVPNAFLDGLADEIKATSAARVKITEATGNKLAESITIDSSLAQIAVQTHSNKILRQQKNAIKILQYATEEASNSPPDDSPTESKEISDDWLNAFESEAVNMSSEQMQRLFGKMLAGEIRKPSSYSVRTVKLMGQMDSDIAQLFRTFCSMSFSYVVNDGFVIDSRVFTLGSPQHRSLHTLGVHWLDVEALLEYGLVIDNTPLKIPYESAIQGYHGPHKSTTLKHRGRNYQFAPIPPKTASNFASFSEYGIGLSRVGRELLSIVDFEENGPYIEALKSYLHKQGLEVVEV